MTSGTRQESSRAALPPNKPPSPQRLITVRSTCCRFNEKGCKCPSSSKNGLACFNMTDCGPASPDVLIARRVALMDPWGTRSASQRVSL
ncbi:protein kinase-like protein [Pochonia chlamydosporia 170]|uniref:Protein kinase-like protein n=1 Tax=Pochonia chlamydosporia 170 TaxID=1380566 RepID=A0A179FKU3_METCM|nr:protein kinase-like protein [Pochonia chlamydosporia 170]OAQ65831.2 protein kinase-like protein [Pochonia chlamydosporia 170]